jgi:DNA/RNA-binding domain of Phe-tRNA-synthetase-like protein
VSAAVTTLPDGRRVTLAADIAARLLTGVVVLDPVTAAVGPGPGDAAERLGAEYRERWAGTKPGQIAELGEARRLYRSCGMEPTRHRPSSEALLRRVLQGKGLYRISNLVDSCNLASLTFLLPIGMYDLARVEGDVTLRLGTAGDEYAGIRKGPVHLEGRLGLFDTRGPFGSPTSDSARTCTGESTRTLLAVIMATPGYGSAAMAAAADTFTTIFAEHCAAREAHRAVLGGQG